MKKSEDIFLLIYSTCNESVYLSATFSSSRSDEWLTMNLPTQNLYPTNHSVTLYFVEMFAMLKKKTWKIRLG